MGPSQLGECVQIITCDVDIAKQYVAVICIEFGMDRILNEIVHNFFYFSESHLFVISNHKFS